MEGIFFCLFSETVKITSREPISQGFVRTLSFALPHHQPLLFFSFTLDTTMGESCILTQKERVCVCVCVCERERERAFNLVLSFGTYSAVSFFCLTFCACFYELAKTVIFPIPIP